VSRVLYVVITAVGLLLAGLLVPGIEVAWGDDGVVIVASLLAMAVILAAVDASVGRALRLATMPLRLLTLGLVSVVVDAALLLFVAALVDAVWDPLIVIGGFPPDLSIGAVGTAALGALVITLVSALLHRLVPRA
jgi:putative membrane protein